MPSADNKPDCVHCRFMVRSSTGEYRCKQHDVTLHSPVSLFCKHITLPEDADPDLQDWFNGQMASISLQSGILYTWLESSSPDADAYVPVTWILNYAMWPAGTFWRQLRFLRQRSRKDAARE